MSNVEEAIVDLERRLKEIEAEEQRIITTVVKQLEDEEQRIKAAINSLCAVIGQPRKYDEVTSELHQTSQTRPDQYKGKRIAYAVEEILKKWREAGISSATLDQLYKELLLGGFAYINRTVGLQKRGIAIAMGKQSEKFQKLTNGAWSLK